MVLLSNPDTNETKESVHGSEVSLFLGLKCMQELFFGKISLLERRRHILWRVQLYSTPLSPFSLILAAQQLQDDIEKLRAELRDKEVEMAEVKRVLGITPYVEFKQSLSHGLEVVGSKFRGLQGTQG